MSCPTQSCGRARRVMGMFLVFALALLAPCSGAVGAGGSDASQGLSALIHALQFPDAAVNGPAIQKLAGRGDAVIPSLQKELGEGSVTLRRNVVAVFNEIRGAAAGRALADISVKEPNTGIRNAAVEALRSRHPEAAAKVLVPMALDSSRPAGERRRAAEAIRAVGDRQSIEALIGRLEEQLARKKSVQTGISFSGTNSSFVGYDHSFDTDYKVKTADGRVITVHQKHPMPIINSTSVQTNVVVTAATVLTLVTGEDFGNDPSRWRRWWKENQSRFPAVPSAAP